MLISWCRKGLKTPIRTDILGITKHSPSRLPPYFSVVFLFSNSGEEKPYAYFRGTTVITECPAAPTYRTRCRQYTGENPSRLTRKATPRAAQHRRPYTC